MVFLLAVQLVVLLLGGFYPEAPCWTVPDCVQTRTAGLGGNRMTTPSRRGDRSPDLDGSR